MWGGASCGYFCILEGRGATLASGFGVASGFRAWIPDLASNFRHGVILVRRWGGKIPVAWFEGDVAVCRQETHCGANL